MNQSVLTADLDSRVLGLLERLGASGPPTDLCKLAHARQVRRVVLRNMIPRGGLATVRDGFAVFIRDEESRELSIDDADGIAALSKRQRFTFAHELAHTFFFRLDSQPPVAISSVPNYLELEEACDRAAGQILVPASSLRRFTRGRDAMSAELAVEVSDRFSVSIAVALRRLCALTDFDSEPIGVLLAERQGSPEHRINAMFFKTGLLPFLPKPKAHQVLSDWCRRGGIELPGVGAKSSVETREGFVDFRRVRVGSTDERFLLEISGRREM
jgi:hypothetical protein